MMTSFIENIPVIVKKVAELKPKNILDVGAAYGKYGLLISEALLSLQSASGDLCPEPDFKITACENAPYFLNRKYLPAIYDHVIGEDIRKLTKENLSEYDLILFIDVIEHWPREDYLELMSKISPKTKVLISTPKKVSFYKKRHYDIDTHITQFKEFDFSGENLSNENSFIYLI